MNLKNRTIFTYDNLPILRGINSDCIDLIYLDPPFNSNRNYAAPIGTPAEGAEFKDIWTLDDVKNEEHGEIADKNPALYQAISAAELTHSKSMKAYLIMMAVRLTEMHRILKPTGSIYLHCDPTASHYLKLVMDSIFGKDNFRNEIIWSHQGTWIQPDNKYPRRHDTLLFWTKTSNYLYNMIYNNDAQEQVNFKRWRKYIHEYNIYGRNMPSHDKRFKTYLDKFIKLHGRDPNDDDIVLEIKGTRMGTVQYIKSIDPKTPEKTGYPTQKPLALLHRIISASSNPNDIVLDPFCGCATTCIAAQDLNRQWIGIDISPKAVELVKMRMERDLGLFITGDLAPVHRTDIPTRTDIDQLPHYRTHKHELYGKQEGICNGCDIHFLFPNLDVDHIVPQSKGGLDHISNLQLLCTACNRLKGTGTMAELKTKLKTDN